jgi:hypothetical protein
VSVTSEDGSDFDFAGGWFGAFKSTNGEVLNSWEPPYLTVSGYRDDSETAVLTVNEPVAFIAADLQDIDLLAFESIGTVGQVFFDDLYMTTKISGAHGLSLSGGGRA